MQFPEIEMAAQLYLYDTHQLGSWDLFKAQVLSGKWGSFLVSNFPLLTAPPSFPDLSSHPAITCLPHPIIYVGLYFAQTCLLTESPAVFHFLYNFGFIAVGSDVSYLFPLLCSYSIPLCDLLAESCSNDINNGLENTRIFSNVILTLMRPFAGFPCGIGPAKSLQDRTHPASHRKAVSFLALNNLLGHEYWLDRLHTAELQGLENLPTELRDMLLEEASGLLQPTVFLRFLVDFSKNHPPEELFQFKQVGQAGSIAEKLRVLCPFCFQVETSSSPNWTFALGIECWHQSRTLSISAAHLTNALSTTFPRATLGFEPTPFGIHLAIQAALTF